MIYFTKPVQWTIAVSETEEKFEVFYREERYEWILLTMKGMAPERNPQ